MHKVEWIYPERQEPQAVVIRNNFDKPILAIKRRVHGTFSAVTREEQLGDEDLRREDSPGETRMLKDDVRSFALHLLAMIGESLRDWKDDDKEDC